MTFLILLPRMPTLMMTSLIFVILKYFAFASERFLAPCFVELLMFYCKLIEYFM